MKNNRRQEKRCLMAASRSDALVLLGVTGMIFRELCVKKQLEAA